MTTTETSNSTTKDKAQEAAGQAQAKVGEVATDAKGRLREQVDQRSTDAGQRVSSTAEDVRSVGAELRKQGKDQPARVADQAADRAERLGRYLTESDSDRILRDVEDFGRRQPWAVVVGGLALGFLGSRFLKASSRQRYETSTQLPQRYETSTQLPQRYEASTQRPGTPTGF